MITTRTRTRLLGPVLIALVVGIGLACAGAGVRIVNAGGDDSCTRMFDYCMTARCTLENQSSSPASVELTYLLTQADGRGDKFTELVALNGSELRTFTHDFRSAGLTAGAGRISCRIEHR